MRSDYTKQNKSKYRELEKKYEKMTVNRQINYGYRGTTPNYYNPSIIKQLDIK